MPTYADEAANISTLFALENKAKQDENNPVKTTIRPNRIRLLVTNYRMRMEETGSMDAMAVPRTSTAAER